MRVFVALCLPQKTKDNLARSAEQMKRFSTRGSWVAKDNYHVTLHFLGEVAESDLLFVISAMDKIGSLPALTLALDKFCAWRGSDVICCKLRKDDNLASLQTQLGENLEANGFDVEHRPFRPHVTVCRKGAFELPFSEVTKSVDVFNAPFAASEIVLFQTIFTKDGTEYKELYRVSLQ
ncbi:MAG: RNA 2',3'-cyclic phosphodiesterase [Corallococcus sp.]|nr:RNA 2',3'-cyclic phosphodiesterase [Corallococcus sp.]MCM1359557.1 RNA 2',3'-cyclic phosphodiesterase [Corallococcus sp.]MCM1395149.1 RNA 2',3'-cyclic phosphodiesterase [Corallococcus sp.]